MKRENIGCVLVALIAVGAIGFFVRSSIVGNVRAKQRESDKSRERTGYQDAVLEFAARENAEIGWFTDLPHDFKQPASLGKPLSFDGVYSAQIAAEFERLARHKLLVRCQIIDVSQRGDEFRIEGVSSYLSNGFRVYYDLHATEAVANACLAESQPFWNVGFMAVRITSLKKATFVLSADDIPEDSLGVLSTVNTGDRIYIAIGEATGFHP